MSLERPPASSPGGDAEKIRENNVDTSPAPPVRFRSLSITLAPPRARRFGINMAQSKGEENDNDEPQTCLRRRGRQRNHSRIAGAGIYRRRLSEPACDHRRAFPAGRLQRPVGPL